MKNNNKYIIVAGNIASGKTTLTQKLADITGFSPIYEKVVGNPYLEDFYKDMKKYSFPLQIYFLRHRFVVHRQIIEEGKNIIQDRSVFEDEAIFAKNLHKTGIMDDRDFKNYKELFKIMSDFFMPPDLVVYLHADIATLMERIQARGRDYEKNIEKKYLENINIFYEEWTSSFKLSPVKRVNSKLVNFHNPVGLNTLADEILEQIGMKKNEKPASSSLLDGNFIKMDTVGVGVY